jgi:hypothetical protein
MILAKATMFVELFKTKQWFPDSVSQRTRPLLGAVSLAGHVKLFAKKEQEVPENSSSITRS